MNRYAIATVSACLALVSEGAWAQPATGPSGVEAGRVATAGAGATATRTTGGETVEGSTAPAPGATLHASGPPDPRRASPPVANAGQPVPWGLLGLLGLAGLLRPPRRTPVRPHGVFP